MVEMGVDDFCLFEDAAEEVEELVLEEEKEEDVERQKDGDGEGGQETVLLVVSFKLLAFLLIGDL